MTSAMTMKRYWHVQHPKHKHSTYLENLSNHDKLLGEIVRFMLLLLDLSLVPSGLPKGVGHFWGPVLSQLLHQYIPAIDHLLQQGPLVCNCTGDLLLLELCNYLHYRWGVVSARVSACVGACAGATIRRGGVIVLGSGGGAEYAPSRRRGSEAAVSVIDRHVCLSFRDGG